MENQFLKFRELHHQQDPLLIGNVWNVQSVKVFEKLNFKAIATSSAAVAETLGYADGQLMSFEEYFFVVERLIRSTSLPLSVDLEGGYGDNVGEIAKNIIRLSQAGVSGINLEDSIVKEGKQQILEAGEFAGMLSGICQALNKSGTTIFINVRCDAFLLGLPSPLQEALQRTRAYEKAAVHGMFFPCITKIENIKTIADVSRLPVNVMCMPGLGDFNMLKDAGVKRISMGNFLNRKVYQQLEHEVSTIQAEGRFDSLF